MTGKSWSVFLALATGCAVALLLANGRDAPQPQHSVYIAKPELEFAESGPARKPEYIVPFNTDFAQRSNEFGLKLFVR